MTPEFKADLLSKVAEMKATAEKLADQFSARALEAEVAELVNGMRRA